MGRKFEPGHAKMGGRQKGTKNKTTIEIKEAIQLVLSDKVDKLAEDLEDMNAFKQWTILNAVAKYVLPTYNKNEDSVEHSGNINIKVSFEDTETPTDSSDKKDDDEDWMSL
jgi:hypothetical protein